MQRENERGVPSHWWSVNPLARGLRSAAKQATKIEGSGSAMKMGSTRDWRSATEMGFASDGDGFFIGIQTLREITCRRGVAENTRRGGRKGNS
jgi:hypothetical protein